MPLPQQGILSHGALRGEGPCPPSMRGHSRDSRGPVTPAHLEKVGGWRWCLCFHLAKTDQNQGNVFSCWMVSRTSNCPPEVAHTQGLLHIRAQGETPSSAWCPAPWYTNFCRAGREGVSAQSLCLSVTNCPTRHKAPMSVGSLSLRGHAHLM